MLTVDRRVEISDIAKNGRMRLSALLDMLQDCAFDHLQSEETLKPYFEQTGNVMFLVSRQIDIKRLPAYGEELTVSTWCYELKRMYGFRNTIVRDSGGEICAAAYETGAFADLATSRPQKIPQELADRVEKHPPFEMEYTPRKIALPEREPELTAPLKVYGSFVDMYGHVNNARYIELTEDFVPDDREISRIRIEYKQPLKKEQAQARIWNEGNSLIVEITGKEGNSCCVTEYSFV